MKHSTVQYFYLLILFHLLNTHCLSILNNIFFKIHNSSINLLGAITALPDLDTLPVLLQGVSGW